MRKAWAHLVRGYLRAVSEGLEGREALVAAADYGGFQGGQPVAERRKVMHMEKLLAHPDVKQAIANVYGEAAGFDMSEALELHVKHIRGEFTDKDGNPIPPSLAALKQYLDRVLPSEPKRMHVLTARVGGAVREARPDGSPPPLAARPIGEVAGE